MSSLQGGDISFISGKVAREGCMKRFVFSWVFLVGFSVVASNQGRPAVYAGADDSATVATEGYLRGEVSGSFPVESLVIAWSQVQGPAEAEIVSPNRLTSVVYFNVAGNYKFVLTVTNKQGLASSDTMNFYVRDTLPFVITSPIENQEVEIGKIFVIRWRMDPSRACRVYLSTDGGLTETMISTRALTDSMVWNVPSSLSATENAILYVREYGSGIPKTETPFRLVAAPISVVSKRWSRRSELHRKSHEEFYINGRLVKPSYQNSPTGLTIDGKDDGHSNKSIKF